VQQAPVLFLDYDNVIHRWGAYRTRHGVMPSDPGTTLFEFAPLLEALLAPYPGLQIVGALLFSTMGSWHSACNS
jgi:hypothetical protein